MVDYYSVIMTPKRVCMCWWSRKMKWAMCGNVETACQCTLWDKCDGGYEGCEMVTVKQKKIPAQ